MRQSRLIRNIVLLIIVVAAAYGYIGEQGIRLPGSATTDSTADGRLEAAFRNRESDVQVRGEGVVARLLRDDLEGSRHQKFLLRLDSGQTLLVAHNIDLAPRIDALREGDTVEFYGEYEWNNKGGVIHWTHHDPGRRHVDGWLRHQGRTYQ